MSDGKKKKASNRPIVAYVLTANGGPIDGKQVKSDTKAAARAQYDALMLVAETVTITKNLARVVTRDELAPIVRPRPAKTVTQPTAKK